MTGTSAVSIVLIERIQARPSNAPASWYKSLADSLCPEGSERGGVVELVIALVVEETAGPNRGEEAGEERAGERDPVAVLAVVLLLLVSLSWLWLWLSVSSSSSPATDDAALDCPVVQPVLLLVVVLVVLLLLMQLLPLVVVLILQVPSGDDELVVPPCFRSCCRLICGVLILTADRAGDAVPAGFKPQTTRSKSLEIKSRPVKQDPYNSTLDPAHKL
jgi:hypothetical protein